MVSEVEGYMRLTGKLVPSAHIQAIRVKKVWLPSWIDSFTSPFSHILRLKILLLLVVSLMRKPFSSILKIRCD
jgi:hypothetical protein